MRANRQNKALQISDFDTDSQSDCPQERQNRYQPTSRDSDNTRPLLQDAESESDKNSNRIAQARGQNGTNGEDKSSAQCLSTVKITKVSKPKKFMKPRFLSKEKMVNSKLLILI